MSPSGRTSRPPQRCRRSSPTPSCPDPPTPAPPDAANRRESAGAGAPRRFRTGLGAIGCQWARYLSLAGRVRRIPPQSTPQARNLMLITIDTLRADHVGAYGYARARTPVLDGLARSVRVRTRVCCRADHPAVARDHPDRPLPARPRFARQRVARVTRVPTLATELHARGFRTAAFVAAFPLDRQFGSPAASTSTAIACRATRPAG